ncbi:MAG TPA: hypothetical protein VMF03_01885 [Steroidobacteraceae bacterium]|nr:hypothetical protein [Steroidobacteraceae bacterium]
MPKQPRKAGEPAMTLPQSGNGSTNTSQDAVSLLKADQIPSRFDSISIVLEV